MISIIISTYKPKYLEAVKLNIAQTIGVPFEIIPIVNMGVMGICTAYNIGASKAKYDYLCFIHEDIEFLSINWGQTVVDLFNNDKELALAGLAGSKYKTEFVTGWTTGVGGFDRAHIFERLSNKMLIEHTINPEDVLYTDVVTLDGVFLFTKKDVWLTNKFNEDLNGFHFYDIDISLRISQKKKVAVLFFIDVVHYSNGKFNNTWLNEAFKFHGRKDIKAIIRNQLNFKKEDNLINRSIKLFWVNRLANEDISFINKAKLYIGNYKLASWSNFIPTIIWYAKLIKHKFYQRT